MQAEMKRDIISAPSLCQSWRVPLRHLSSWDSSLYRLPNGAWLGECQLECFYSGCAGGIL